MAQGLVQFFLQEVQVSIWGDTGVCTDGTGGAAYTAQVYVQGIQGGGRSMHRMFGDIGLITGGVKDFFLIWVDESLRTI